MRKHTLNENYFEKIDTEEKAYWLGFIAADGYLNNRHNTVGITLDVSDSEHLEKFIKAVNSTTKVRTHASKYSVNHRVTTKARVELYCGKMDQDLRNLGIDHKKTTTLKPLSGIPTNLLRHFIRGYFDGDGCVFSTIGKDRKGIHKYYRGGFTFVGTFAFLTFINESLPFQVKSLLKDKRTESSYTLYILSNVRFNIMYEYLYKDATIYLDRKYEKSNLIKNNIEESSTTKRELPN